MHWSVKLQAWVPANECEDIRCQQAAILTDARTGLPVPRSTS